MHDWALQQPIVGSKIQPTYKNIEKIIVVYRCLRCRAYMSTATPCNKPCQLAGYLPC